MENNLFYLGGLKEVLPGITYEEKIQSLVDCIYYAHRKGYSICERRECSSVLTAAWARLKGPLSEKVEEAQTQLINISQKRRRGGRSIEGIIRKVERIKKRLKKNLV